MKLILLLSGKGHPMFGVGRMLPGWFLGVAGLHEVVATYLLLRQDEALGLGMACIFMGGVLFSYTLPEGLPPLKQIPGFAVSGMVAYAIATAPAPLRSKLLGTAISTPGYLAFGAIGMATGALLRLVQ
eukprot:1296824-Prymnesium_polylepis.1